MYYLREALVPYNSDFTPENSDLRAKNTYFSDVNLYISTGSRGPTTNHNHMFMITWL